MNNGPVIIVDDDGDDRDFLYEAWKDLGYPNEMLFMGHASEVLSYLRSEKPTPFLILCDVNIPKIDGYELKEQILKDNGANYKSIPFVFWSSGASKAQIQKAYDLGVNGFFIKENSLDGIKQSLVDIVNYWRKSVVPA